MSGQDRLADQLARMDRVKTTRRGRFYLRDEFITLSHGSGGKATHNLVEGLFAAAFSNPPLDRMDDSAVLNMDGTRIAFTTDSYVVRPLFFPGGDIGRLAVHGTVNDLAVSGAVPAYISLGIILEEGFPIADLRRIVDSLRAAAAEAGVAIVTGDTKVVERGRGDGVYINTAGIGLVRAGADLSTVNARPGDRILVSGTIAEHGVAIMMARNDLDIETDVESDTAPLHGLAAALLDQLGAAVRVLTDPTRGGVATALNEIALQSQVSAAIDEARVPIRADVRGVCELLGIDPLHVANEGKLLAVISAEHADDALEALRAHPLGRDAAIIGEFGEGPAGVVSARTEIGGERILDMLVGDALPRIC